jgi:hypothetical protein
MKMTRTQTSKTQTERQKNPPNNLRRHAGPNPHADVLALRLAHERRAVHAERRRGLSRNHESSRARAEWARGRRGWRDLEEEVSMGGGEGN